MVVRSFTRMGEGERGSRKKMQNIKIKKKERNKSIL